MPKRTLSGDETSAGRVAPLVAAAGPPALSVLLSLTRDSHGAVPKQYWGLSRSTDLQAPRPFLIDSDEGFDIYDHRRNEPGPYQIVRLKTSDTFGTSTPMTVIPGVKVARFGAWFDSSLRLSEGLEVLSLGDSFNRSLENLPHTLIELELSGLFNYPLENLPKGLKKLILSCRFNHPINLPLELEEVHLGDDFNQIIALPATLKSLSMSCARLDHPPQLPEHLEALRVKYPFSHPIVSDSSLDSFEVDADAGPPMVFPPHLCSLSWMVDEPVSLPVTLKEVEFGASFGFRVLLHEGLQKATFWSQLYRLPFIFPSTLQEIVVDDCYGWPVALPPGCVRTSLVRPASSLLY